MKTNRPIRGILRKPAYVRRVAAEAVCFFGMVVGLACSSSSLGNQGDLLNSVPTEGSENSNAAAKLIAAYDDKNCKDFISAFPRNFRQFDELFGYDGPNDKGRELYPEYQTHIPYFFECSDVAARQKMTKVISIGINGKWDADGVGLFQDSAFSFVKSHPRDATEILDGLSDKDASSFWYFLFDGPHPNDKENMSQAALIIAVLGEESKQSRLLKIQFQRNRKADH